MPVCRIAAPLGLVAKLLRATLPSMTRLVADVERDNGREARARRGA
jgi:hypothetical protein